MICGGTPFLKTSNRKTAFEVQFLVVFQRYLRTGADMVSMAGFHTRTVFLLCCLNSTVTNSNSTVIVTIYFCFVVLTVQ